MSEEQNWFNRFASLMDQNIRGVQYGIYCVSGLALILAVRSVRPFIKFIRPADIPKHFLAQKQPFVGKVVKVEYSSHPSKNPVLLVDHYPLVPLPWKRANEGLPIEVSSVDVTLNGLSWMQTVLIGNEISFTPLRIDSDRVHSIVYNKRNNIGHHLVSTGLATVSVLDLQLENDPFYLKYYKALLAEEEKAEVKRAGVWANSEVSYQRILLHKIKTLLNPKIIVNGMRKKTQ